MWIKGPGRHVTAGNQYWCSGMRREILRPTLRDVAVEAENSGQTIKIEEPVTDLVNAWIQGKWGLKRPTVPSSLNARFPRSISLTFTHVPATILLAARLLLLNRNQSSHPTP